MCVHVMSKVSFFLSNALMDKIDEEGQYLYKYLVVSSLMVDLFSFCM